VTFAKHANMTFIPRIVYGLYIIYI
jgi:hypothetical protein